jgi:pimeloyl-ACP methyl ester carboxylesterase
MGTGPSRQEAPHLTGAAPQPGAGAYPSGGAGQRLVFEERRLAAFRRRGFSALGRRIPDRDGRQTYILVSEQESASPTVLVHGGVGNTIEWADLAPRLRNPLVIPDRPGFGLSYPTDYHRLDFRADAARWLLELTDGLGIDKIDLVGNSMGGFFAIAFAAAHPDRVRKLVLCGAAGGLFPRPGLFLQLWATPGVGALISRIQFRDTEMLRKRAFGAYLTHPERIPDDLLEVALLGINLPGTADTNRAIMQAAATFRGWRPQLRLEAALVTLPVPTLFICGDHDPLASPDVARQLSTGMPDAHLTVIPDAGHIPHLDQPEPVAAALNEFLSHPLTTG